MGNYFSWSGTQVDRLLDYQAVCWLKGHDLLAKNLSVAWITFPLGVYNLSRWFNNISFVQELVMISKWLVIFLCPQCPARFYSSQMWRRQSVSCSRFCNDTLVKKGSFCYIKFHTKYQIFTKYTFSQKKIYIEYTYLENIKPL